MDASDAPRDARFEARYNDIPRGVETAKEKLRRIGAGDLLDDSLARAMGRDWEPDSRYCHEFGKWIFWHGDGWSIDRKQHYLTRCRDWMLARHAAVVEARPSMAQRAATLLDDKTIYAVAKLTATNKELACTSDDWDTGPMLLGGPMTVDLRTGEARDSRPLDYMLKRCSCAPAPRGTPAPLWHRFLDRVTAGDVELQAYLQRACGYWLTGSVEEEVFFFIHGGGQNGKSKFLGAVQAVLGDYADTIGSEVLMISATDRHPTELAKLRGLRLAIAYEVEDGRTWAEAKIKALTGGDKITARFMRRDFFSFWPTFKLAIIGNHKPRLRAVDEAIKRRMHLIPFTVTIPPHERDKHLARKLQPEYPAILRWMIDGCLAWQERGLDPPKVVRSATEAYFIDEDSFQLWRSDCTTPDPNAWESSAELWQSWRDWATQAGEFVGAQKAFSQKLVDRGSVPAKDPRGNKRGYRGAKLRRAGEVLAAALRKSGGKP
jgi:putative DNA primase/helicase